MTNPKRLHSLLQVAAFCGAGLILGAAHPAAAQSSPAAVQPSPMARTAQSPASPATAALQTAPKGDLDQRVRRLHSQLGITPEQEELWRPVATAMVDSASGVGDAMQARFNKPQPMSAIDDIRTYQAVANAHAKGLMQLADAFAPLYAAMPPAQQKAADKLFGTQMARRTK
ncbi:MAG: Spy/CpxP family protein refolding chaperone [Janthinobacterium lividum]